MLVKYIIPEDGDEFAHPNVFNLQSDTATLNDVRRGFPVPGTFHFRFLKVIGSMTVWMDAVDGQLEIPLSNGSIFLKVSRPTSGFPPISIPAAHDHPIVDTSSPQPAVVKPPKPVKTVSTTDNLIFDYNEAPKPKAAAAATFEPLIPEDDLLGMSSSSAPKQSNASNNDLFGLESLQPVKPAAMNNSRGVSPMGGMSSAPMMQQQQQQQPQQSMNNNNNTRHGSVGGMGGGIGMQGGGGPKVGGFDPFDNLTGLSAPRPMGGQPQQQYGQQQQQQNNFNSMNRNNNTMNQNNRGRGF